MGCLNNPLTEVMGMPVLLLLCVCFLRDWKLYASSPDRPSEPF